MRRQKHGYEVEISVFIEDIDAEVELKAEGFWDNDGIGSYEYWGAKCFDAGHDYFVVEKDPKWNRNLYTKDQNEIIEKYVKDNADKLNKDLVAEGEKDPN